MEPIADGTALEGWPEGPQVSPEEFNAWLVRYDLNDANAARLFGVNPWTVKNWRKVGLDRTAAVFFRVLSSVGMTPWEAGGKAGIGFSGKRRANYRRKGETPLGEAPSGK